MFPEYANTKLIEPLSPAQRMALRELMVGAKVMETALARKRSRQTVHRWIREDGPFREAYNYWKQIIIWQ